MLKEEKVRLLNALKNGTINLEKFKTAIRGAAITIIKMWEEIEPGIYKERDNAQNINGSGEKIIVNIKVKNYHDDGTKCPRIATNENEIDIT